MSVTQETRRQAYEETREMASSRRLEILDALARRNKPATAREIAGMLGYWERNAAAPRLTELKARGLVRAAGKGTCRVTGKTVTYWEITDMGRRKIGGKRNANNG